MKRTALTLMALALTGAVAFAQDAPVAKVSGYVNAGIVVTSTSDGVNYKSRANDFGADGYVGKLGASYGASNYGVNATVDLKQSGGVTVDTAYAWVSPIEGFKLLGGSGNDNPLGDVDNNGAGMFSTAGLTAEYTMSGFTAGLVVSAPVAPAGTAPVTFGARYAIDKVAILNVTGQTEGNNGKLDTLRATASLQAIEKLNASVGYNSTALSTTASNMIDAEVGYQITDAFKAGAVVWSYSGGTTTPATTLQYKPYISYVLGGGLTFSAFLQGDNNSTQANYQGQGELDYALGGATIKTQVIYDTAPNHVASDKSKTTLETDFIFSF